MNLRLAIAAVALVAGHGAAAAEDVPIPKPRPASLAERFGRVAPAAQPAATSFAPAPELQNLPFGDSSPHPSPCDLRLREIAVFTPVTGWVGPGECGAADAVRLSAVVMRDDTRVMLNPAPTLRCSMAEAAARFIRDELATAAAAELGSPLASVVNFDSYECRGRNRVAGAKLSEHGKGNALDIRGVKLASGVLIELTDPAVAKEFRERARMAACGRFSTVLGPGSDGYHENHIHLDLAERSRGHRMCQWDVRVPPVTASVPLPPVRPLARDVSQTER